MIHDYGIVTAYGYAKSKGYTGTEEEFAELMAQQASVAEEARQSAAEAEAFAFNSLLQKLRAQAWASGEMDGDPVPETDETYHNNAKYYAEASRGKTAQIDAVAGNGFTDLNRVRSEIGVDEHGIINGDSLWRSRESYLSFEFPAEGYSGITITAGENGSYLAFLKESVHGLDDKKPVAFSDKQGARIFVPAGETKTLEIPEDCVYIVIFLQGENDVRPAGGWLYSKDSALLDVDKSIPELSILFVGNSLALDSVSYVPAILSNLGVKAKLIIGILYLGGRSLLLHAKHFKEHDKCYTLFESVNLSPWKTVYGNGEHDYDQIDRSISADADMILTRRKWNIISFQQGSIRSGAYSTYKYLKDLIEYINQTVDYKWKMAWNNIHSNSYINPGAYEPGEEAEIEAENEEDKGTPIEDRSQWLAQTETNYAEQMAVLPQLLADYPIEVVFPVATAVQYARRTVLGNLEDDPNPANYYGYDNKVGAAMLYDGKHAQEGIACQVEGYVIALKIMELLGIHNKSIMNDDLVCNNNFTSNWKIPGKHGKAVPNGESDSEHPEYSENAQQYREIAQQCAIRACAEQHDSLPERIGARIPDAASVDSNGLLAFTHGGVTLFSVQLPIYGGETE